MAHVIDGKALAAEVRAEVKAGADALRASRGVTPGLAVVRVGEDPASKIYVGGKRKAAAEAVLYAHHGGEAFSAGVLAAAALTPGAGVGLLAAYALGLGVPFLLAAFYLPAAMARARQR